MSHLEIVTVACAVGNLTTLALNVLAARIIRRGLGRSLNFAQARETRVAAARICEGCRRRGRHGHSWFCPSGDIPFFNYHDMNTHVGWRQ